MKVKELLQDIKSKVRATVVTKSKGIYTAKWCYYYRRCDVEDYVKNVLMAFPEAEIVDSGDHWHSFVGGAKTGGPQDSYMYVKFKI